MCIRFSMCSNNRIQAKWMLINVGYRILLKSNNLPAWKSNWRQIASGLENAGEHVRRYRDRPVSLPPSSSTRSPRRRPCESANAHTPYEGARNSKSESTTIAEWGRRRGAASFGPPESGCVQCAAELVANVSRSIASLCLAPESIDLILKRHKL